MLVGDIIISARRLMPDLPRTLPPAAGLAVSPIAVGATLPPGTYNVVFAWVNQWGETPVSAPVSVTLAAGQGFQVTAPAMNINPNANGIKVYFALQGQPYVQMWTGTTGMIVFQPGYPGVPSVRNSSFFPDADGPMVSSWTVYDWLNEALTNAAYICKGIPDTSGIQMVSGNGMYQLPGIWDKFENSWYDGYPVAFDARGGAFYRNRLSGITFIAILQTSADKQVFELQPQPSRSGGSTTSSAPVLITDSTITLTNIAQFGLTLGMAQLGIPPNHEIVSYSSISGNQLTGVVRGLGGTQQVAWTTGTIVNELNFRFGGLRLNSQTQYYPGQSATTLQVPPGWKAPLVDYLVGRFRELEKNTQASGASMSKFEKFLGSYTRGTKQTAGPRQVGPVTPAGDGYPSASSGGR